MILRSSVLSLVSLALPLLVGVVTVPIIIHALGGQRFGALTLVWGIIGYAGVLDLGISRALTKRVAELDEQPGQRRSIIRLGIAMLLLLGLALGGGAQLIAAQYDYRGLDLYEAEYTRGLLLLAVSLPFVLLSGGLRGTLEGLRRFIIVAAVRFGFGLLTFIAPVFVLDVAPSLDTIIAIMLIGRLVGCGVMAWACKEELAKGTLSCSQLAVEARHMLCFGGWITVSNLVSALMLYLDRFLIAAGPQAPALVFYTTPYEFVTKLFIVPSALSGVLFPHMSRIAGSTDAAYRLLGMGSGVVLLSVMPMVAGLVLFSEQILCWWLGPEFAVGAALPLRILAIGVLLNCLAQIFQTYILSQGKASWMGRLHLLELIGYLPALYFALQYFGIEGVAWVWTLRVGFDALAMALEVNIQQKGTPQYWWIFAIGLVLVVPMLALDDLSSTYTLSLWGLATVVAVITGAWFMCPSSQPATK